MWNASFDDDNFDVIVTPTTPISGRPIDQSEPYLMVDDGTGEQYFYSEVCGPLMPATPLSNNDWLTAALLTGT